MNIAFYYNNGGIVGQDYSTIKEGNPGIGGTQYAMILLATFIAEKNYSDKKFYLFAESALGIPSNLNVQEVSNYEILSKKISDYNIDILVVNKIGKNTLDNRFFSAIEKNDVKVIIWAHCFIPYFDLLKYAKNEKVARIVAVSKEQLLTWCDHSAFRKSSFIYNICNYSNYNLSNFTSRGNNVVYIGSIIPLKGLHLLTAAWPKVLSEIPDAQLFIIGNGKLYNKKEKLGKYEIAEFFYEKKLLNPIIDEQGNIHPSVHFLGVLGNEKFDIMNNAKVVVPNPSGLTETFGYTAVEAQLTGCLVTTKKCPGYIETVYYRDNILYDNINLLADSIISLLKYEEYNPTKAIDYLNHKFSNESIILKWEQLFNDIYDGKFSDNGILDSKLKSNKYKILNKKINSYIYILPSLMLYELIIEKILYILNMMVNIRTTINKIYRRKILKL